MSIGVSKGGLPPDTLVEEENFILKDCQRVIETFHDDAHLSMLKIALAPCSPFSVSQNLMKETAILARDFSVGMHTHLAENKDLAFRMLAVMARRHRQFQKDITDIKSKTPGQRLGGFILAQTLAQTDVLSGSVSTSLPFDKALIAARIGIKPESLSRALARLRDIGVDCQGRDVHIEDIQRLREFCEETEPHPSHR